MSNLISKINEIGIKNICEETHITEKNIRAIIDKDFKSLHRPKALGFVRILEQRYNLDFDEWLTEFNNYSMKNYQPEDKVFTPEDKESKPKINSKIYIAVAGVITVLIIVYMLISNQEFKNSDNMKNSKIVQNLVSEAKTNLDETKEINNSELSVIFSEENKSAKLESNLSNSSEKLFTQTLLNSQKENPNETNSKSEEDSNLKNESIKSEKIDLDKKLTENFDDTFGVDNENSKGFKSIYLKPRVNIWVGVIYLDNYKKKNFITKKRIDIDTTKEQLIVTGHDRLDLFVDGKKLDIKTNSGKLRFVYKDNKIKEISVKEFQELNRGKIW